MRSRKNMWFCLALFLAFFLFNQEAQGLELIRRLPLNEIVLNDP